MRHLRLLTLALLFISLIQASGQYYETGQSPASYRWREINSGRFRIIYPDFYEERAKVLARTLESAVTAMDGLYDSGGKSVPVVIHGSSIESNGFVAWAPRRMELYPLPEQDNIPMEQMEQLAIHEAAHILQMQALNKGITKGLSALFGEHITGAVAAYIPFWFLEGDAVFAETAFSESGRGRDPGFLKNLKAISLERGQNYNYDKLIQGSYRDFVPNHYESGYLASLYIRSTFGADPWKNALNYAGRAPYTIFPFNISMRRDAGLNKKGIYRSAFAEMANIWGEDDKSSGYIDYVPVKGNSKREFVNYNSPLMTGVDTIIAIRRSLADPPAFVMITDSGRREQRIFIPGPLSPYHISESKGKIVWAESRPDPRWENRGFSVIRILNLKTGLSSQLTTGTRYFSPDISPAGDMIVAAASSEDYINSIALIDAFNGRLITTVPIPENDFPQTPRWSEDGNSIAVIMLSGQGESIKLYNLEKEEWSTAVAPSRNNLRLARMKGDSLFYISSANGTEDLYLMTGEEGPKPITASRFGVGDYSLSGSEIVFTDYHYTGYNIVKGAVNALPDRSTNDAFRSFAAPALAQGVAIKIPDTATYSVKPYRKSLHLFNFHSWIPAWADPDMVASDPTSIRPGVTLLSQNNLSTLITVLGYEYDRGNHLFHAGIRFKGAYPVWESSLSWGGEPYIYTGSATVAEPVDINPGLSFRNDVYIPLKSVTGKWSQSYLPHIYTSYNNQYIYVSERATYDYGQLFMTGRFYFSNVHRSGYRDIYPRFAQVIDIRSTLAPFDRELYGPISTFKGALYFPGLLANQGIRLRYEHDKQKPAKFIQHNRSLFPRGIENIISEELDFVSVDYVFPIVYPDLRMGSILYIPRIRGSLFFDYATGTGNRDLVARTYNPGRAIYQSFGAELIGDFHLLRIPFPISMGVRATQLPATGESLFSFVFDFDLYGFGFKNVGR